MEPNELLRRFPNASASFVRDNSTGGETQGSEPERPVCNESVGKEAGEMGHSATVHVRITSFRTRLLDPDNLCPKYFIDCLRYSGLIPNDRAEDITLEVRQFKVKTNERTEIEIEKLPAVGFQSDRATR